MKELLERLQRAEAAKTMADAQLQVAEKRLVDLKDQLKELGIDSDVDVEALKDKIALEMKKAAGQLDVAEEILSEINTGRLSNG